jgi:chorismate synthase
MAGNTFGSIFRLTTFGESHGQAIGGIIDGCPAGLIIDLEFIQSELDRRKPGQSELVTQRKEKDQVDFVSGIFQEKTTGAPIAFFIKNSDQKSQDYDHLKDHYRPSHADYTYEKKYQHRDFRGSGRASARETACRVVAGAIAKLILKNYGISVKSYVSQIGKIKLNTPYQELNLEETEKSLVRCPDEKISKLMIDTIQAIKNEGDSIGGVITGIAFGVPVGLGEPVFDKLHADLGKALLSINAVKGFEFGSGFEGCEMKGSEHNDIFVIDENDKISTTTNYSGGIQGGISNGQDIYFRVAFKPVSTIMKPQESINNQFQKTIIEGKGRHDACILPRAVPVVEAMTALVLVDHLMKNKNSMLD